MPQEILNGLISFWEMDESSGDAQDAHGSNVLSEDGIIGSVSGKVGTSRELVAASGHRFSHTDNADLSIADIDFTWAAWAYANSLASSTNNYVVHKLNEYGLLFRNFDTNARFAFLTNDGTNLIHADSPSPPALDSWYFLLGWHDSVEDTVNIQVDDGTVYSAATGAAPANTGNIFYVGRYTSGVPLSWDGRVDQIGFWKRVLTADERSWLYGGGNGRSYAEMVAAAGRATDAKLGYFPRRLMRQAWKRDVVFNGS